MCTKETFKWNKRIYYLDLLSSLSLSLSLSLGFVLCVCVPMQSSAQHFNKEALSIIIFFSSSISDDCWCCYFLALQLQFKCTNINRTLLAPSCSFSPFLYRQFFLLRIQTERYNVSLLRTEHQMDKYVALWRLLYQSRSQRWGAASLDPVLACAVRRTCTIDQFLFVFVLKQQYFHSSRQENAPRSIVSLPTISSNSYFEWREITMHLCICTNQNICILIVNTNFYSSRYAHSADNSMDSFSLSLFFV